MGKWKEGVKVGVQDVAEASPKGERRGERRMADKDTSDAQILEWDEKGKDVFFETQVDRFRVLPDNVRGELSRKNLDRYWVSYHHWKDQERLKDEPKPFGVKVEPVASGADTRQQVVFKDPAFPEKWHECWIRPDEVRERSYRGYVPVDPKEVEVFCSTPAGPPAIVDGQGRTEMLLYKIPNELYEQQKREQKQRGADQFQGEQGRVREQLNRVAREASPAAPESVFFDPEKSGSGTQRWHEEPSED